MSSRDHANASCVKQWKHSYSSCAFLRIPIPRLCSPVCPEFSCDSRPPQVNVSGRVQDRRLRSAFNLYSNTDLLCHFNCLSWRRHSLYPSSRLLPPSGDRAYWEWACLHRDSASSTYLANLKSPSLPWGKLGSVCHPLVTHPCENIHRIESWGNLCQWFLTSS